MMPNYSSLFGISVIVLIMTSDVMIIFYIDVNVHVFVYVGMWVCLRMCTWLDEAKMVM